MTTPLTGRRLHIAAAWLCLALAPALIASGSQSTGGADRATAIQAFTERIEAYASLRDRLAEPLPSFQSKRNTWSGLVMKRYLASAIRSARAQAHRGDIFTPAVTRAFRELNAEMGSARDEEGRIDGLDVELLEAGVIPAINEPFPVIGMRELPPALVVHLPALPQQIEYRLVGPHLILWDADTEVVIDVLPDMFVMAFDT